jgi:DNA/RNA endonuclease G (NUC1)
LPRQFWEVVYFREQGNQEITAKGYVLTQADLLNRLEMLVLPEFSVYEVPINQIGNMTGLTLPLQTAPEAVRRRKAAEEVTAGRIRRIASVREIIG